MSIMKWSRTLTLVGLVILELRLELCLATSVEVSTKIGRFTGRVSTVSIDGKTKHVQEFLGIPYAKSPVGHLRFKRPERRDVFREPFNASWWGPICPQSGMEIVPLTNFAISEDCLYLNIFVPNHITEKRKFAVMVYIHGGNFITGASNFYVGDVLSAFGDVIVVTLNYRLSIFGFLSTADDHSKGNFGLWDQQLAIQWVHEHIASFHGNPHKVTLFGQSAGAASVIYQAFYPGNRDLFQRVIAESGTPVSFGTATLESGLGSAPPVTIGRITGCPYLTSSGILECLREKRTEDIMDSLGRMFQQIQFEPTIDGEFIADDPQHILRKGSVHVDSKQMFSSVDLLIGGNSMEGASYLQFMWKALLVIRDLEKFPITPRQFKEKVVPKVLQQIYGESIPKKAADAVNVRYSDLLHPRDSDTIRDMLVELSTDYGYRIPNLKTALLHSDLASSKTFTYEFTAHPTLVLGKFGRPGWVTGANHGDEAAFVFGFSRRMLTALDVEDEFEPRQEEVALSLKIMKAWTNFAKHGDPSPRHPANDSVVWPEFTDLDADYMEFGLQNSSAQATPQNGYGEPAGSFWLKFMPRMMQAEDQQRVTSYPHNNATSCEAAAGVGASGGGGEVPNMRSSVCCFGLIALGTCTVTMSLSLIATCFYFRKKQTPPAKYDAVEV